MITEQDLREAIAECEGIKNPSTSVCIKLAAFYTILEHLYNQKEDADFPKYSFSSGEDAGIQYSGTEFSDILQEKGISKCFPIIDELMSTIYVINPALYRSVIRKLTE